MKILLDSNIAIDVLLKRQPFLTSSAQILGLPKFGIELFLSAILPVVTPDEFLTLLILPDKSE